MDEIQDIELVNKFLENSLSKEELELFNQKYKEEAEFSSLVNTFFDISIAVKAADKYGKSITSKKKNIRISFGNNKWFFSIAASAAIILILLAYTASLYNKNKMLSNSNFLLSENISKVQNEIKALSEKELTYQSIKEHGDHYLNEKTKHDKNYLSNVMALNKVIESINSTNEMSNTREINFKIYVFPLQSKLIDINNASVYLDNTQKLQHLNFYLVDIIKNDTVFKIEGLLTGEISLKKAKIVEGKKYHWALKYNNKEVGSGNFTTLSVGEKSKIKEFTFRTADDYIEAFIYYYNNGYYFDVQATLNKATKTYPYAELFSYLQKLLLNLQ
jgi:hypothetical protein